MSYLNSPVLSTTGLPVCPINVQMDMVRNHGHVDSPEDMDVTVRPVKLTDSLSDLILFVKRMLLLSHTSMHTHTHTHICIYLHVCVSMCICVRDHFSMNIYIYVHM